MNSLHIIGNLTADPELRATSNGKEVCTFTVAVNRRGEGADFFRVSAWEGLAKTCSTYLRKGRKVSVVGSVSGHAYVGRNNEPACSLEVRANDVEFLTPARSEEYADMPNTADANAGFTQVETDELPF